MNSTIFVTALGNAIVVSLIQGLVIWIVIRLWLLSTSLSAATRYNVLFTSLMLQLVLFVAQLGSAFQTVTGGHGSGFPGMLTPAAAIAPYYPGPYAWVNSTITKIYFLGLFFHLLKFLVQYRYTLHLQRKEALVQLQEWTGRLQGLQRRLKIAQSVSIHFTEDFIVPFTAGFFKPVILFPLALVNQLTPAQVEAILIHELAHVRRRDYLLNLFQKLVEMFLFFNPFVWLILKDLNREREDSCDDIVYRETADVRTYAGALLKIEETRRCWTLGMAASGKSKYPLYDRIKRLTDMNTTSPTSRHKAAFLLFTTAAVGMSLAFTVPFKNLKPVSAIGAQGKAAVSNGRQGNLEHPELTALMLDTVIPPVKPLAPKKPLPAPPKPGAKLQKPKVPAPPPLANHPEWKKFQEDLKQHSAQLQKQFDSQEWKNLQKEMAQLGEQMKKQFDSQEWKQFQQDLKKNSDDLEKQFNSSEWKKMQEDINENVKKQFDSPEWKRKQAEIQRQAEEMSKKFNSPEWKQRQEQMRLKGEELRKKFDSPEWKQKQLEIQKKAEEMRKKFDSPEWKQRQEEMRLKGEELRKKFDSPEWKQKQLEIQKKAEEMGRKFNSPEWKQKQADMERKAEEMQKKFESREWKDSKEQLQDKAEQEVKDTVH